ncbi:acetylxylan esterase [Aureobasidium namibiae CBS 147.97]|uniref:Acetylxylan esterase n=1 Tax=Aureobasidium namibiae CBS 147.97 TaxID=1043004 RepID=A0A074WBE9_9PEZI
MGLSTLVKCILAPVLASATILQNGQVRDTVFANTSIASVNSNWTSYPPNTTEISYKGRWDTQHISWWSAPGLKLGFTGDKLAISFGQHTSQGVLVTYRFAGQDWMFSNVTANSTHQFVDASTLGFDLTLQTQRPQTFELRVTNYAYGVQIAGVHVAEHARLVQIPNFGAKIEVIGDSLSAGQYATYEGISSYAWGLGAGLGNVEFDITAYPGICLVDQNCWGNAHGQVYQWLRTSDTSSRSVDIYGDSPPLWDFAAHQQSDIVVINLGTNDNNTHNNVTNEKYLNTYIDFVAEVHGKYPHAQIILIALWNGFDQVGNTYQQGGAFVDEIKQVYAHYKHEGFVHYFNTTGILQHNDIGPQYHPTDVGHVKLASHLMQYIKLKFGWVFGATGPEVQADTLYWNDEANY